MTLRVPHLPISLDPLIAEAKRRARRRRLLLALGIAAAGAVALTVALQSGAGPGGVPSSSATGGPAPGAAQNEGPVLAGGVAPVTGGMVVATVMLDSGQKVGQRVPVTQVATAPIDASGSFVLRPDPSSRPLSAAIVKAIATNSGWVNLDLLETGSDGKTAITGIARQYVNGSGKPLSLAEFRAAPRSGHWIGNGTSGTTVDPKYEVTLPSRRDTQR